MSGYQLIQWNDIARPLETADYVDYCILSLGFIALLWYFMPKSQQWSGHGNQFFRTPEQGEEGVEEKFGKYFGCLARCEGGFWYIDPTKYKIWIEN